MYIISVHRVYVAIGAVTPVVGDSIHQPSLGLYVPGSLHNKLKTKPTFLYLLLPFLVRKQVWIKNLKMSLVKLNFL